jgi:DNA replication and repair protein RecF
LGQVFVTKLQLTDFRNWESMAIACDRRHVVLVGENGAGKTNVLEAVSFLTAGRGLRRAGYETIARRGGPGSWSVFARLDGSAGEANIGTGIQIGADGAETQRRIRINGASMRSGEALLEYLRVSWLVPAMDGLFTGPASERRRFLDRLVLALDPAHGKRVSAYEQSMRERNRLLGDPAPDPAWLSAIEAQMAETGVAIAIARYELSSLLTTAIEKASTADPVFPQAQMALSENLFDETEGAASDAEESFRLQLRSQRIVDAAAGRTLCGPHRADLVVSHRAKGMEAARCSTGEQKALLVGIVLAHARLVADMTGAAPLLLLDEIAAHLDARRRAALFERIDALACQAWMTGTDLALFSALDDRASVWRVADNAVVME